MTDLLRQILRGAGPAIGALSAAVLLACPAAAPAAASSFGELTRFGLPGHNGQSGFLNEEGRTLLLGADPSDNSVYVLDEPEERSETEKPAKGQIEVEDTRHFRLQKFTSSGSSYSFSASRSFDESATRPPGRVGFEAKSTENDSLAVEGIAVDAGLGRVYVLAVDWRQYERKVDKLSQAGSETKLRLPVASALYAFSTTPSGSTLVPAPGTKTVSGKGEGVLAGPEDLKAQSDEPGAALLEPSGITVDPATHDVVILAHADEGAHEMDNIASTSDHFVLQRVSSKGEEGLRYTDGKSFGGEDFFSKAASPDLRPHSPVISGTAETGTHVFVAYGGGIVELPADFSSKEAPKQFFLPPPEESLLTSGISGGRSPYAPDFEGSPENEGEAVGGVLSSSSDGTLYGATKVFNELSSEHGPFGGLLSLSSADGSVLGWAGGQVVGARAEEKDPEPYLCVVAPVVYEPTTPVAAGSEGKVFMLALSYLWVMQLPEEENEPPFTTFELYPETFGTKPAPAVIEFGPGGAGCPGASSTGLVAKVKGSPVTEAKAGEAVTFSAPLTQANALSAVEWDFGDGTKETLPAHELPRVEAVHAFGPGGTRTVRATIHTDNLATPAVSVEMNFTVAEGAAQAPIALASGPLSAFVGEAAEFDGSASSDPGGPNQIAEYHWSFGDGQQASSTHPTLSHTYTSAGAYTVSLTVTNKQGVASAPDLLPRPVSVSMRPAFTPAVQEAPSARSAAGGGGQVPPGQPKHAAPDARLAGSSLAVSRAGVAKLRISCPVGVTLCIGKVQLRTLRAASAKRAAPVTLASGRFTVPGGSARVVTLRLTAKGRAILAGKRRLRAVAVINTHDTTGAQYLRQTVVTLRSARASRGRAGR